MTGETVVGSLTDQFQGDFLDVIHFGHISLDLRHSAGAAGTHPPAKMVQLDSGELDSFEDGCPAGHLYPRTRPPELQAAGGFSDTACAASFPVIVPILGNRFGNRP